MRYPCMQINKHSVITKSKDFDIKIFETCWQRCNINYDIKVLSYGRYTITPNFLKAM